ncbi:hypothetical protein B0A48_17322 [Cryoendolithus antarcticus]|uniref:Rhodopsin domain-containing protein n=1 Tax=Cryoendolithus antarcticus TaxID=1507870 RepID=A0A1V8SC22_9PEZI|nr:hypothetical protein B0A48_17322 [Cryoendolithus antarcticus]
MAKDTDNVGPTLFVIAILTLIVTLSTTTLRLIVRHARRALGNDDYCITAATILTVGRITCQFISLRHGNGKHRWTLSTHDYQYVDMMTMLTQLFLFPILCLLKVSVCLLVLRIKSTKKLRWGLWGLITLLVVTTLLPVIVLFAECRPMSAYWTGPATKCWDAKVRIYSIYVQTAVSVLADVICTLLPVAVVWDLSLSMKNKIAVCGLMGLGVISTAFAVVKTASLGLVTTDTSWTYGWAAIWGDLELGFGILGANLALSRTYWDYLSKSLFNLTHHSSSHSRSNPSAHRHPPPHAAYTADGLYIPHSQGHTKKSSSAYSSYGLETFDGGKSAGHRSKIAGGMGKSLGSKVRSQGSLSGESDEMPLKEQGRGVGYGGGGIKREVEFRVEDETDLGSREREKEDRTGYAV